ncbi:MAG: sulfatase-like hydrolase/transferase [Planctomycetota bacterium]|jgi:arylsulfatase A-like enzyme
MSVTAKPNFIIFLTDDQGYVDLSCMGSSDLATPQIDALAEGGACFTDCYSNSSVCSPARASLLTGRYPGNAGVRAILAGHRTAPGLTPEVPTLAAALKEQGYNTYMAGKWHLGTLPQCRPSAHGFDNWFGHLAGCIDYYSHIFYWAMNKGPGTDPVHDMWEDDKEIWDNGRYFTELITEKALDYIRDACCKDKPFFLFVPYNAPHYPMHAPEKYLDRFPDLTPERRIMAAMLSAVDDSIGEIMAELKKHGVEGNTCTFYTSDNGPSRELRNWLDGTTELYKGGTTGSLKGHKFSLFEGGTRVPGIMHWPEKIPAGQIISDPVAGMDIFPTFLKAAGGNTADYELDGTDILSCVSESKKLPERTIFWELMGQLSVRKGDWKLVLSGKCAEGDEPEDIHLCNLKEDKGESTNLAAKEQQLTADLKKEAEEWLSGIEKRWQEEFLPRQQGLVTFDS